MEVSLLLISTTATQKKTTTKTSSPIITQGVQDPVVESSTLGLGEGVGDVIRVGVGVWVGVEVGVAVGLSSSGLSLGGDWTGGSCVARKVGAGNNVA